MDASFWNGKKVLLTGHTGFKGGWTCLILKQFGATVVGVSLKAEGERNFYTSANVGEMVDEEFLHDITNAGGLAGIVRQTDPDVILHMAAQSLVKESYADPAGTFATNVMGTVNLFEAARQLDKTCSIINVTSDKCYENREWVWPYRENEPMGGSDPYSSSKGCSELVTASYRRSFFAGSHIKLASTRAGNVVGGGDWAKNRLIPDIVRAHEAGEPVAIRHPNAVRPWQFVLEPISGYLALAERLYLEGELFQEGWNFGPFDNAAQPVSWIVERFLECLESPSRVIKENSNLHEAQLLKLDWNKAKALLSWSPRLEIGECLEWTARWYREFGAGADMRSCSMSQVEDYLNR